jgi:Trk-type K+ transport system membrane component
MIIWTMHVLLPDDPYYNHWKETLRFVLDHPRRVYTHLFPSTPTWWLVLTLIFLNGADWMAFELLNLGNTALSHIPTNYRVLDGLFQALAVRSGGFYIVPIPTLRIGVQVLYVIMMYISVYPVVITMRNSNVYEERSLGIYAEDQTQHNDPEKEGGLFRRFKERITFQTTPAGENRAYFVHQQVRGQLAHDLSWLVIAVLLIVCIETGSFERDPLTYSVFNVVFEITSAYGCVGITIGLPDQAYSFAGGWHKVSKLILCAVMLRGRHRGLPVAIDRAVLLPGDGLAVKEEEDHDMRRGVTPLKTG